MQVAWGQSVCATPGKDGSTFTASPNTYYPGTGTAAANATSLTVGAIRTGTGASANPIGLGDLLLVIQMQGADINNSNTNSYGSNTGTGNGNSAANLTAGQYEYVVASSMVGTTINLSAGLKNTYVTSGVGTTATLRTFQVVRVPQYSSLTLTADIVPPFWNGSTGGIVALDVQGLMAFGTFRINASALGFRGGAGIKQLNNATSTNRVDYVSTAVSAFNAQKGEGIAGSPQYVNYINNAVSNAYALLNTNNDNYPGGSSGRGAPGNAGGGGNDNGNNSGGGGGANAGTGGHGGYSSITATPSATNATSATTSYIGGEPGAAFTASSSRLIMGGGGGAGTTNDGSGGSNGFISSGTPGGGIVIVRAGTVSGSGGIAANGGDVPSGVLNDGGGGGGAGGSILLTVAGSQNNMNTLTMSAMGGNGGTVNPGAGSPAGTAHGPGGGGGGGVIFTTSGTATPLTTSTAGGTNGTTTPAGTGTGYVQSAFGATAGTSGSGQSSVNTSNAIANSASGAACTTIGGTIFDDLNYGGGSGRSYGTANTSAVASGVTANAIGSVGTTVEIYNTATGAFVATTTTTAGGAYSFTGLTSGTSYTVRVVNSTVKSVRTPGATGVVPVQTFRTTAFSGTGTGTAVADGSRVGGEAPEKQDAAAGTSGQPIAQLTSGTLTPQSIASVTAGTSGVDFGYSFDVIVNTNDAGQGSLRQFITNANALGSENLLAQSGSYTNQQNLATGSTAAGRTPVALPASTESSIFMIPASALAATNGVAVITTASVLPQITGPNTAINGATQTFNIGNTNDVLLGAGGTVGTGGTALSRLNGPEVQLVGSRTGNGLELAGVNATVRGLSVYAYATQLSVADNVQNTLLEQNVIGTSARSFSDPGTGVRGTDEGIFLANSDGGIIRNNLIGYNGGMGIWVYGAGNSAGTGANNNLITNNELRGNAQEVLVGAYPSEGLVFDGLELQGNSTGNTVSGNLITESLGNGIDSFGNDIGGNTVTGNTISNNGQGIVRSVGVEGSGLRVYAATNTTSITNNIITGNNGSGVLVESTANQVRISQNSIYANTRLSIDLLTTAEGNTAANTWNGVTATNGVTINDSGDGDTGGNGVLNFPVITSATVTGGNLVVTGFARPGALIELYTPAPDASGFGEGQTYLGTVTEGGTAGAVAGTTTNLVSDTNGGTGTYGTGNVNNLNQGADNTNAFTFTIPLTGAFAGFTAGSLLTSTATIGNSTSEFSGLSAQSLSGYVYEDVNYGGGAGRPRTATGASVRSGARVELYDNSGNFVTATTTDASGQYFFSAGAGSYTVRVVNSTVTSSRPGYVAGLLPVQTYNGTTTRVGGEAPAKADAAANTTNATLASLNTTATSAESQAIVTIGTTVTTGPDFGFNFDVVVNTNSTGQGSLRQFILNANALGGEASLAQSGSYTNAVNLATGSTAVGRASVALPTGVESSIFMIPAAQLTGGVAIITPATALPQITGPNTGINGGTQTFNIGNTNDVLLGTGGSVGTGSTALSQLNGPEVQLTGSTAVAIGLNIAGAGSRVRGLAIYGFGNGTDDDANGNIVMSANNVTIADNAIGSTATSFTVPAIANVSSNVRVPSGTGASFTNNLVGFAGGTGIYLATAVTGTTITSNEIRGNGRLNTILDGVDSHGSSTTATGNLFADSGAQGFDSYTSTGSNVVTGNTFTNNGTGNATSAPVETAAARFYGTGNTFSQNVATGNYGAGVEVGGGATLISRNSIYNNGNVASANGTAASGQIGIDLLVTGNDENLGTTPFVTLNSATTTGGNGLLNYPVLRSVTIVGTNLVVTGYAKAGAAIELFTAQANPAAVNATGANFGQGRTYLTTLTEGATTGVVDNDAATGQSYSGSINGFNQGADTNANGFSFAIPLSSLPGGTLAVGTVLTSTATLNNVTSEFSGNATAVVLTGYVYEDVNYGGGAGRPRTATSTSGRPGARVELYDNSGNFVTATTTDANGLYGFGVAAGSYTVRVVNSTVTSSRPGYVAGLLPVQTYNGTTTRVGGEDPAKADAAANTTNATLASLNTTATSAESQAIVTIGTSLSTGPDFGFNFDVVTNTNDAGQGSLRQFIINSNALGAEASLAQVYTPTTGATTALTTGLEMSIFMIPNGTAVAGLRSGLTNGFSTPNNGSGTAATITLLSALPNVTGPATAIDGRTQTRATGDSNLPVTTAGAESTGPEVLVNANNATPASGAFAFDGNGDQLLSMGVYGSNTNTGNGIGVNVNRGAIGTIIQGNTINNNGANISFQNNNNGNPPSAATISGNIIRDSQRVNADGIELNGNNSNMTISGNQLLRNNGFGIDFVANSNTGNTITNNTFIGNGRNLTNAANYDQTSGIGLRAGGSNNNTISNNTFLNNNGAGIVALSNTTGNVFSQNTFSGNGVNSGTGLGLGIDLMGATAGNNGDGVTLNDSGDGDTGGNGRINFPILQTVVLGTNGVVTVSGFARSNTLVELFLAADDPTHFGEGSTYLTSFTQGSAAGTVGSVVTGAAAPYSGVLNNGLIQGADNTNTFTYTFTPTAAQLTLLRTSGALLTSTATLTTADASGNFGTSEFSGNARVEQTPVPNDVTNAGVPDNQLVAVVLSPNVSATAVGSTANVTTTTANTIASYVVDPVATGGTLYYNGTAVTTTTTVPAANIGQLTFVPVRGFVGNATFTYTAIDANGLASTTHNTAGTVTNGPATYTIPVTTSADVTASLTGGTTLSSGQATGYYTATFTNLGPDAASNVAQIVTLPNGATLTMAQQNALLAGTTVTTTGSGASAVTTITFPPATSLGSGLSNSFRFAFTAPTTAGSSTLVASTGTTSSEGAAVATNSASLALTTIGVVDLQASISVGFGTVSPGNTATFTATFSNNSTPTATGVVATVQLIPGLTAGTLTVGGQTGTANATTITFANGAVYTIATGQITYAPTTLAAGSVSSIITLTMPASGVVMGTASITTTSIENNLANNVFSASIVAGPRFDLATTISGPTTVVAGSPVTLSVTTTNNSGQAVTGAVQTVQLPTGLNPTIGPPGVFISNGGTYDNTSGVVTFPALGSLPSGQTVANTITFLAPSSAFTPSAQVTPNTTNDGDTNPANNTAYLNGAASSTAPGATLTPAAATATVANMTATLTTTSTIVSAATQVTYTVGASNAGPGAAATVTGQLQLLPGLNATTLLVAGLSGTLQADNVTYNFADGTAYKSVSYNSQTGLLSYAATAASLASGTGFSFPVAVTVPATVGNEGQLLATNSVGSATSDNVPADNVKAVTITVRPTIDLVATLMGPTSGVAPGQNVTYTATFTNNGPDAARVTAQTVQLPSGLTISTLTVGGQTGTLSGTTITFASGATYSTTTGLVTLPALASDAAGAVQAFNLTFVAPAQSYVVSAAISSATTDTTPANNAASVATAVSPTADVAVAVAGPATAVIGNYVTYSLTTTNNGPSTATNVVPTLRLPAGLTIQSAPVGYTYDNTGLLTFPAISALQTGVSAESYVTFTMPNAAGGQLSALASVSSNAADNVPTNNTAAITTSVAPATTTTPAVAATTTDLRTSISPTGTSVAPGSLVTYTAAYRNNGTLAATNVVPTVSLPAGLLVTDLKVGGVAGTLTNGLISFGSGPAAGATYEVATGLLTFPTIASLAYSATATSYSVTFSAPNSGQLVVVSTVSSNTSDLNPADNSSNSSITVTSAFDLTTSISGPASALVGSQNVYTIKTINSGPSSVSSATQNVQLPANLTTSTLLVAGQTGTLSGTTITYSNAGASYDTGSGLLTFAGISNLASGLSNAVSNTITVTMPNTGSLTIGIATVGTTATGETSSANNTATFTTITAPLSFAPVAQNIVNSLRSPEGNTANALAISPLNATDPDGSISNYYIQSLPTSGTLYYNGAAISSIPTGGYQVADATLLSFDPANTFAGDVFFTYTATDNNGVVSNTALYTIPVAQDVASTYTAYNTAKGGANTYKTNDILAQVIDPNKAVYTGAGTIFDTATGALQAGAANGLLLTGTNAVLATTGPAGNATNTLPAGVSLDAATGRIYVSNASQLANFATARTYSVFVITTDANGGISQALATFTIGAYPLPVVLTDFTAQAVQNRDALLNWATASEKNNDHFDIERSFDGTAFAKIGTVAGHGTTSAASAYTLTDAGVAAKANGPVYYRLRQVDLDGTATFSPVRSVRFSASAAAPVALSLYPNPAQASTQLDLSQLPATGTYQVLLLDATGRTVRSATLAGGLPQPLSISDLAAGTYHVLVTGQLADGSSFKQTLRLTKE